MTTRTVAQILDSTQERVGHFAIRNVLPSRQLRQIDPFLLIHHMGPLPVREGATDRIPPHPHAGFEVVTYLLDGSFYHRDSLGNNQVASAGDVNWMTSGAGIVHSEGPSDELISQGGTAQLLQVWINLPAKLKQTAPLFRHYPAASFPTAEKEGLWVRTLLGSYEGKSAPVPTHTALFWHHVKLEAGTRFNLMVDPKQEAALYLMAGVLKVLGEEVKAGQLLRFERDGDHLSIMATEPASFILFGGEPIGEKVVSYGPFVMNSMEEIQEAVSAYEAGRMGNLDF